MLKPLKKSIDSYQLIKSLWKNISSSNRRGLILLLFLSIFSAFFEVIGIGAVVPFLAILISPEKLLEIDFLSGFSLFNASYSSQDLTLLITLIFVIAIFLASITKLIFVKLQAQIGHKIGLDIGLKIYTKSIEMPYLFHLSNNTSRFISLATTKVDTVVQSAFSPIVLGLSSLFTLSAIMVTLILINPIMSISTFGFAFFIYIFISKFTKNRLSNNSQIINEASTELVKAIQEGLGGIRDIKIDKTEQTFLNLFLRSDKRRRKAMASNELISISPKILIEAVFIISIALAAFFFSRNGIELLEIMPQVGALAIGAQRLMPIIHQIYSSISSYRSGFYSLQEIFFFLSVKPEEKKQHKGNKVFFKEKKSMVDIGRFVVITGPDGAGKSTLINEVGARFSKHFTVKFLHFGQPAPSVLTLLVHVMLWFRRAIYSFRPNKTTDFSGASKKKNVSLIFALRYLALAYDRNRVGRKALAYVNRGFLVIADRYPSNNLGEMDSPKLDPELAGNWWFRQMAYMENRLYHSILESDLLIRVKVSRQTAMARNAARVKNHKETDQEIVERHTAFNKLSFNAKKQLIFENEGSLETAANTLFFAIWAEL